MVFGVCLNSFATAARVSAASSRNGLSSYNFGKLTVTDVSRPLFQLKPTLGFTPVTSARSVSTALECLRPSLTVLTASHPARAAARRTTAMGLYMSAPDQVCLGRSAAWPARSGPAICAQRMESVQYRPFHRPVEPILGR